MDTITEQSYPTLLKDPRWQRKRLEVMKADNFTCQCCFRKDKPLNVHHKTYIQGAMPWEYETRDLITLCEDCHKKYHHDVKKMKYFANQLEVIACALKVVASI